MVVKILFLIMFIAVMVGVGLYSRRHVNSVSDFFLGGRNMGGWVSAFAYGTSYFSAVIFIGYAGKISWGFGLSATWIGITNAFLGCTLAWVVLAHRTRKMTHDLNVHTMPEFFEKRYNSKIMKVVCACVIFIFLVPYTASVYKGLGYLFETSFGVDFSYVVIGMATLTAIYLLLGGYVATAINDLIQGIIMLGGVIFMIILVVNHQEVGGISNGLKQLKEIDPGLTAIFSDSARRWNLFGLVFMTSFGTWGLPQMIHKFYAIKDKQSIQKGTIISTIFALIIGGIAYFTGVFGRLFLDNKVPIGENGVANYDMVIPKVLETALPDALIGIIIILILSASMSTLSSLVLVSSSSISIDLIKGFISPKMDDKKNMLIMRILCTLFVIFSVLIALLQPSTIVTLMSLSWGVISGMFLAPYLFGLWWKGTTKAGAWSGFISGGLVMLTGFITNGYGFASIEGNNIIKGILISKGALFVPGLASVAMIVSLITVPLVSLVTKKYSVTHIEKIFIPSSSIEETVA